MVPQSLETPARPSLTLADFLRIVEVMPDHLRPAMHVALGAHLRLGELAGLQCRDLDASTGTLTGERQMVRLDGKNVLTATKTRTAREVALPRPTLDALTTYLSERPKDLPKAPMFTTWVGVPVDREMVSRALSKAIKALSLDGYHFHDVRHLGLTLTAQSGATLAELMQRAGHSTSRAAMLYQHAAEDRRQVVAEALGAAISAGSEGSNGTPVARPTAAGE